MANDADLLIEAGFSDAKLARESAKVIGMFKDAGTKAEKAFQSAVNSVSGSEKVKATAREIEKLKREFDPLYASSKRYEAQLTKLDRAHETGAISAKQHAAALERMNSEFAGGASEAAAAGRRFGGSLQQVGFQIGDFATQVGAGTSATQALGQQLPQLLGAFGTFGALAGAAAAVMIPLGSALVKTAFDSETLADRMKSLEASTDAMQEAAKLAAMPISELRDKYGDLADEVARANGAMAAFTAAQAGAQLKSAAGATAALFPDAKLPTRIYGMSDNEWAAVQEAQIRKLQKATGATREQAEELAMALRRLESANGPEAVYRDAENLLSVMSKLPDATEKLAPQFTAIDGLMRQALAQMEAQRSEVVRLREEYDATTGKLRDLAADLSKAEAERAKASAAGKAEEVAQWDRVIAKIREMVYETRAAASETDTLFERMAKGAQGFIARAGGFMEGAAGRMVGSTAISVGKQYAGMKERPNREELKALVGVDPATVAWCAAFMNAVLEKSGSKGTGSLSARSFLNWGQQVENPGYGDIVVLKRGSNSRSGHVGFYEGENPDGTIRVFGGNQSDGVRTSNFKRSDVLGYRRAPMPGQYVDPEAAVDAERIAQAGVRAAEAEKEQKRLQDESAAALKRQVAERERAAEAVRKYGELLAANLVDQKKEAELAKWAAEQTAQINASGMGEQQKAAALAAVTAEVEKQRLAYKLMAEAKAQNVNLDAVMGHSAQAQIAALTGLTAGAITYRQAIDAITQGQYDAAVAERARAASAEELAQRQQAVADINQSLNQTLYDAVLAGEGFDDVLKNITQSLIQMAAQALIMGQGPLAELFGISGGLFSFGGGGPAPSFEGGGFTGMGSRTGGIDGRGGFPAILHPNETVIDHTRARAHAATATAVHVTVGVDPRNGNLMAFVDQRVGGGLRQADRAMPSRVATINRDPLRR